MKTSNQKARAQVQQLQPFKGNNTFAEYLGNVYVVYSYGKHWPLFAKINGRWIENENRFSVSTSKHHSQLHPLEKTRKMPVDEMKKTITRAIMKNNAQTAVGV
jgi:hypothetical protein